MPLYGNYVKKNIYIYIRIQTKKDDELNRRMFIFGHVFFIVVCNKFVFIDPFSKTNIGRNSVEES